MGAVKAENYKFLNFQTAAKEKKEKNLGQVILELQDGS